MYRYQLTLVRYVNREVADKYDMYAIYDDHVTWTVDARTVLYPGGPNRKSIRLISNNNYTHGEKIDGEKIDRH